MQKSVFIKIMCLLAIIVFCLIVLYFVFGKQNMSDEKRFKTEYEKLNGLKNSHDKMNVMVKLPSDNNVKYASFDEVMEFLDNGTGILFLGFPECPWCRNAVPILVNAALKSEIDDFYYFNALSIRDEKKLDNGKIVTTKKGDKNYYKLVDKLKDFLGPYKDLGDDSIKRIYFPTAVFVQAGKIVGVHIGTVESQKDPYKVLDKKQKKELEEIYKENIDKIYGVCDDKC